MEYTDKEAIENYILKTIDDGFDAQLTEYIIAMSKYIDNITHRAIFRDTPEIYKYDGDGTDTLQILDCNTITEIALDGTVITDYFKYPSNKPYTNKLKLDGSVFTEGLQNVLVTAKHGFSATLPEDIKFACTVLVAGILNDQQTNDKKGTTERIGGYSISYKDDQGEKDYAETKRILNGYTKVIF